MKRLILHVGYPKTGTTTLQKSLFPNLSSPHAEYIGKFYNERFEYSESILHEYRHAITTKSSLHFEDFLRNYRGQFRHILDRCRSEYVIWSVEGFLDPTLSYSKAGHVQKDNVSKAQDLMKVVRAEVPGSFETKVLITIRNQADLLASAFCHSGGRGVKSGRHRHSFASFIRFCLDDTIVGWGPEYDFLRMSSVYGSLFGTENVIVLPMEGLFDENTAVYRKRLAQCLGQQPKAVDSLVTAPVGKRRSEPTLKFFAKRYPGLVRLFVSAAARVSHYPGTQSPAVRSLDVATSSDAIKNRIREYYRTTNQELSATRDLALHVYRYW